MSEPLWGRSTSLWWGEVDIVEDGLSSYTKVLRAAGLKTVLLQTCGEVETVSLCRQVVIGTIRLKNVTLQTILKATLYRAAKAVVMRKKQASIQS